MIRAQKATDYTITASLYAADEETLTDATGDVTVTVARADGTALTGGTIGSNNGTTGKYDFTLDASTHLGQYDNLKVTFTATVSGNTIVEDYYVKVVGRRFFKIAALRELPSIQDTTLFPNARLKTARDVAEDFIEDFTETAWVPQYRREIYDGLDGAGLYNQVNERAYASRTGVLFLYGVPARSLIKVVVDGTTQTTTGWTLSKEGRIVANDATFPSATVGQNIEVQYEWGYDEPNGDLVTAALRLTRHLILNYESSIPDRARMMQTEWGLFHLDVANVDRPTGLPEVDAILCRYRHESPVTIV